MKTSRSPYPGHNGIRAIGSTRPASEAPDPLPSNERPTDHDELKPEDDGDVRTTPDAPGPILLAIGELSQEFKEFKGTVDRRFTDLEKRFSRHGRIENVYRMTSQATPMVTLLAAVATVVLSFAAMWLAAQAYREAALQQWPQNTVVIEHEHLASVAGAVYR